MFYNKQGEKVSFNDFFGLEYGYMMGGLIPFLKSNLSAEEYRNLFTYEGTPEPLIPDEQLPCYLAAADVVFIQRTDILNSGNVPLALSFGRVVTGPASGNIGGLLAETGNPAFDPADPRSVDIALERAARLSATDQGARNRAYAQEHFGIGRIAAMYGGLYERLYDGKRQ